MSKGWDNATLKKLKALTGKGLSTSEIGKRLGLSKNAVVGKLNRLGWNSKATSADAAKSATADKKPAKASASKKESAATSTVAKTAKKNAPKKVAPKVAAPAKTSAVKKSANAKTPSKADSAKKTTATKVSAAPKETTDKKSLNKSLAMHQRIIQHSLEMANLKPNQCRWPIGDPDSEHFHFCGETVFVGKPYCYEHCKQAYQFAPPKKK